MDPLTTHQQHTRPDWKTRNNRYLTQGPPS
jgi:hypothetical protein